VAELDPPNLGEVLRRIDDLSRQIVSLVSELKEDRAQAAKVYLRADVYNAERNAQNAIVADLHRDLGNSDAKLRAEMTMLRTDQDTKFAAIETDRKGDLAWRRQVLLFMAGIAISSLLSIVGLILTYTGRQ